MTYAEIVSNARFITGAAVADWSAAQITLSINNWYQKVVTMILAAQDEWDWDDVNHTTYPIFTLDLVANQQDYQIPASLKMLKIKRVEAKLDGTNWVRATPIDINQISDATDTTSISNNFSTSEPFYDVKYNGIFLYPIPAVNVDEGLKYEITREVDEFTTSDTTQEPGIDEPFHNMISLGAALDWEMAKKPDGPRIKILMAQMQEYEQRLKQYYGDKQTDRNIVLKAASVNYD